MSRIPVLWMSCDADRGPKLDHAGAMRSIRRALQQSGCQDGFRMESATDLFIDDIEEELERTQPELLILSTHALRDGERPLLKDAEGKVRDFDPEVVAERLTSGGRPPRLVVLNMCNSQRLADALLEKGVHAVIGSAEKLPVEQVKSFLGRLCGALFKGVDAATAFKMAKPTDGTFKPLDGGALFCRPAKGVGLDSVRFRPRPAPERRRVVVLDAYDTALQVDEALARLTPAKRETQFFHLSTHLPRRLTGRGWDAGQLHWPDMAQAVDALLGEARRDLDDREELVLLGHAPLLVNAHVGQALSSWSSRWVMLNRRKAGAWDLVEVQDAQVEHAALFRPPTGLMETNLATGWVAVFVSVMGHERAPEGLAEQVRQTHGACAGVVSLLTPESMALHQDNAEACAAALRELAKRLPARYPNAEGLALFVAGPATLAFLAGRAFNVRITKLSLWEFQQGRYYPAYGLPTAQLSAQAAPLPLDAEAQLARRVALDAVLAGAAALRRRVRPSDLRSPGSLSVSNPDAHAALLHAKLMELDITGGEADEAFQLSVQERRLSFGAGLLQALVGRPADELARLSQLFVLHELYHYVQGVDSRNYRGVGRAGLVLEEVDYQADAFAVLTTTLWEVRRRGEEGEETCGVLLQRAISAVLSGLAAFDRMEQGEPLRALPERRLRRYLIWALQLARARTVRAPADIEALFAARPFVELAPLRSSLSRDQDKLAEGALPETELFISLGGRLLRLPALSQNFSPAALVDAARRMDSEAMVHAMAYVVARHEAVLAPWVRG